MEWNLWGFIISSTYMYIHCRICAGTARHEWVMVTAWFSQLHMCFNLLRSTHLGKQKRSVLHFRWWWFWHDCEWLGKWKWHRFEWGASSIPKDPIWTKSRRAPSAKWHHWNVRLNWKRHKSPSTSTIGCRHLFLWFQWLEYWRRPGRQSPINCTTIRRQRSNTGQAEQNQRHPQQETPVQLWFFHPMLSVVGFSINHCWVCLFECWVGQSCLKTQAWVAVWLGRGVVEQGVNRSNEKKEQVVSLSWNARILNNDARQLYGEVAGIVCTLGMEETGGSDHKGKDGVVGCARTRRSLKYRTWCLGVSCSACFSFTSQWFEDSEEEQSPEKLG